jgi:hypothetical protein
MTLWTAYFYIQNGIQANENMRKQLSILQFNQRYNLVV